MQTVPIQVTFFFGGGIQGFKDLVDVLDILYFFLLREGEWGSLRRKRGGSFFFLKIPGGRAETSPRGGASYGGEVKQGRFVILKIPLFCSVLGSQDSEENPPEEIHPKKSTQNTKVHLNKFFERFPFHREEGKVRANFSKKFVCFFWGGGGWYFGILDGFGASMTLRIF